MTNYRLGLLSLKYFWILVVFVLLFLPQMERPAKAESNSAAVLTFDVNRHRALPNISNISRIRFLMTLDYPPFSFLDRDGRMSGLNVDLAREICDELKVTAKCQIQALPFDELETALQNREGDAVIAGVAVTAGLRRQFDFSQAYLKLSARFLVHGAAKVYSPSAQVLAKMKVGVVKHTSHEAMFRAFFPGIKTVAFESRETMMDALKSGDIDVVFSDGVQLAFWKDSPQSDDCCHFWGGPYFSQKFLGEGMTIMTRRGEPLAAAFDHALLNLAKQGKLHDLTVKYLPSGVF